MMSQPIGNIPCGNQRSKVIAKLFYLGIMASLLLNSHNFKAQKINHSCNSWLLQLQLLLKKPWHKIRQAVTQRLIYPILSVGIKI